MERKEFSELLVRVRKDAGMSRYALGWKIKVSDLVLRRIESAANNYGFDKVLLYLSQFGKFIFITNGTRTVIITSEAVYAKWIVKTRENISRSALAKSAGISITALANIEKGEATARIDTFLKIIEALGYHVEKIE